jgi:DNA recombination protein RmuC
MQPLIAGLAALAGCGTLAGILLGYWLRHSSARQEKRQLELRLTELTTDLTALRAEQSRDQAQSQALAAQRAGFESLALEREKIAAQLITDRDRLTTELQTRIETDRIHSARIGQLEAELANERQNLQEKVALLDSAKDSLAHQFQSLAAEILDKKSQSFAEGTQKELGTLLNPLRDQIKEFREKVEQSQTDSKTGVTKLETLIGTLGNLNQQLTEEARNLTTALRGSSKAQGDWGELIVRNLLEKAGLREGEQFRIQETFDSAAPDPDDRQRKARPDVIVNLPGGRHLVIDSKVSLNAYTDSVNAVADQDRAAAIKRHLSSVRAHIDGLALRRYHKLDALESPDFVVMFIPIEPAFLTALHEDESLWRYAYDKEVLLVGPTTLLFVIRIVDNLWQQDLQDRNAQEIKNRATALYEKFVGFVTDLEAVGKSLRNATSCYDGAMSKLSTGRDNLIRQVEKMKKLGIRPTKSIPRNLLDTAGADEPTEEEASLTLAAQADTTSPVSS